MSVKSGSPKECTLSVALFVYMPVDISLSAHIRLSVSTYEHRQYSYIFWVLLVIHMFISSQGCVFVNVHSVLEGGEGQNG